MECYSTTLSLIKATVKCVELSAVTAINNSHFYNNTEKCKNKNFNKNKKETSLDKGETSQFSMFFQFTQVHANFTNFMITRFTENARLQTVCTNFTLTSQGFTKPTQIKNNRSGINHRTERACTQVVLTTCNTDNTPRTKTERRLACSRHISIVLLLDLMSMLLFLALGDSRIHPTRN